RKSFRHRRQRFSPADARAPIASIRRDTMTSTRHQQTPLAPSRATLWVGWIAFAAIMMFIVGGFNIIDGFAAIFKDEMFVTTSKGILVFDITAWGWIHLVLGVLQCAVAFFLLRG